MMSTPEVKLKRFLHYGKELPRYEPGDRFMNKSYDINNLTCIDEFIKEGSVDNVPVIIMKAFQDGYSVNPEAIVFVLAACSRNDKSRVLQLASTQLLFRKICQDTKMMFLFIKFHASISDKKSTGHAWRKTLHFWYASKDSKELGKCVTKYRGRHGWTHRDVMRLIHMNTADPSKRAVLKYIFSGLEATKAEFGDEPKAQDILNYFQLIEDFKHSTDAQQCARLIELHDFEIDHVPAPMLKFKEVWMALIPHMALADLLQNIQRLSNMGYLKGAGSQLIVSKIVDALNSQSSLEESKLHPAEVMITLKNYENCGKCIPKVKTEAGVPVAEKPVKTLPKPNPAIVEALNHLFHSSFKLLVTTGMRYLVAIDTRKLMTDGKCWQCGHISPARAALLVTLCLLEVEREVTILTYGPDHTLVPFALEKGIKLDDALTKLCEHPRAETLDISLPLVWAKETNINVDVFVVMCSMPSLCKVNPSEALQQYRDELNLPKAKLVSVAFSVSSFSLAKAEDVGMLDIVGFDGKVPRVIEAFSRGAF